MTNRQITAPNTILSAKGATGVGTAMFVADFRHIMVTVATDGGGDADLTVKIQGSLEKDPAAWATAQSVSNMWDYVAMYDLNDPSSVVTGDTGFVVAGADDYKQYIINVDGLTWINAEVTARSAGEVTVKGIAFDNE